MRKDSMKAVFWYPLIWMFATLAHTQTATNCTNGEVRLLFGVSESEGTVEICVDNLWGTICRTSWGSREAKVVCQQLGFLSYASAQINARYGRGSKLIRLNDLRCIGTENSLLQCPHDGIGVVSYYWRHSCAGVRCFVRGNSNCSDGEIRLRHGFNELEGRVEICIEETWGTICDNSWDSRGADVVCSQLGFPTLGAIPLFNSSFGSGSGPIWLDFVLCQGEEENLLNCPHNGIGVTTGYYCDHFDEVGVQCLVSSVGISCNNGDIRLASGSTENEGRVEVCYSDQWGTVCDDSWSSTDAKVVCRQLGYPAPGAKAFWNAFFGGGNGGIFLDNVRCTGSESVLINCSHLGIGIHNCDHTEDAGVRCSVPTNCTNGEVRLLFGVSESEGTVEICADNLWGTICHTSWGSQEAKVVCQQLGFLSYANAKAYAFYGRGSGPIWLDNLHCNGTEGSLLQCLHNGIGVAADYCDHSDDAGVRCFVRGNSNCSDGEIRLRDGSNELEGRVEICIEEIWGTICDSSWDSRDADVVCSQLGFPTLGAIPLFNSSFGSGSGPIWLDFVSCQGEEENLLNCPHNGIGVTGYYCDHFDDVGVQCPVSPVRISCNNGDIRLASGSTENEGRVEVCYNDQWGTVCDDSWSNTDVRVVCRQLGYPSTGAKGFGNSLFRGGNGGIFLDNVRCTGSESALINCSHSGIGVHNCDHTDDAGVRCLVPTNCTNGEVRLLFGVSESEGTVEICVDNLWGSICDTSWGIHEAKVVCQQLGFLSYASQKTNAFYGRGSGLIWLNDLRCNGAENSLLQCPHNGIGVVADYCDHSDDAGVRCFVRGNSNCSDGEIRLRDGSNELKGRVEICIEETWGTICDSLWDSRDAGVVCSQLGFPTLGAIPFVNSYFGSGSGPIWLDFVSCKGEEENLLNCPHSGIGVTTGYYCDHFDDVGVQCPVSSVGISCNNGDIRLVSGSTENEGRVEVCYSDQWGTVCDDSWSSTDARVVCRQLGYPSTGAKGFRNSFFGGGNGGIFLDNVGCTGSESALINCSHSGIGVHNCYHTKDAGVRCLVPTNCTDGEVRLLFGSNKTEGTVEICVNKLWGSICDTSWGTQEAKVICKQLGFLSYGANKQINAYYGRGSGPILLDGLRCNGTESSLLQCPHYGIGVTSYYCDHSDDAGVTCFVRGKANCSDGEIRLRDGSNKLEGRVEICIEETWGTICDSLWDSRDADVVCSQLGFPTPAKAQTYAYYGRGSGPIWLDGLRCNGTESSLLQCPHRGIGVRLYSCDHSDDAGVTCSEECPEFTCRIGQYLSRAKMCNHFDDCDDGSATVDLASILGGSITGGVIAVVVICVIVIVRRCKCAKHSEQLNITHRLTTPCEIPVTTMTTTVSDRGPDRSPHFNNAPQEPPPYPTTSPDFSIAPQEPPPSYPGTSPDFNTALQGPPPPYPGTSPDAV